MKTVIYHSADYDGIFCREIARKFLGDQDVQYLGWNFGEPPVAEPPYGHMERSFIVMDLPLDKPFGLDFRDGWACKGAEQIQPLDRITFENMVWIDHHKTSIETHPRNIPGYRIDGVAACRLAWQWFKFNGEPSSEKGHFRGRIVNEPLSVRLAGEYDVWEHEPSNGADIAFQFGLDAQQVLDWKMLLSQDTLAENRTWNIVGDGQIAMRCYAKRDADNMRERSFILQWEGLKFLTLNTIRCNSITFAARDVAQTGHDALLAFFWNGETWLVSLYHAAHRKDIDLSDIAKKHGGGGHKGACGFTCKQLPFL